MAELEGSHNGEAEEKGTTRSRTIAIVVAAAIALVAAGLVIVQVGFDRESSVPKPSFSKKQVTGRS